MLLITATTQAQGWVTFHEVTGSDLISDINQPSLLTLGSVGSGDERTHCFAIGDFDQDGGTDVTVFCKPPNWSSQDAPVVATPTSTGN